MSADDYVQAKESVSRLLRRQQKAAPKVCERLEAAYPGPLAGHLRR